MVGSGSRADFLGPSPAAWLLPVAEVTMSRASSLRACVVSRDNGVAPCSWDTPILGEHEVALVSLPSHLPLRVSE